MVTAGRSPRWLKNGSPPANPVHPWPFGGQLASMTENPPKAAPAPETPQFHLVPANPANLLHTMVAYAAPATQCLNEAFRAKIEAGAAPNDALRDTPHYDTIRDWCEQHPGDAARIVLCAVYLASGRFVVQEEVQPAAEAQPPEAAPTA